MKSFRVHTCQPHSWGPIPYMVIEFLGLGMVTLDFSELEPGIDYPMAPVTLSALALYDLLQGRSLAVSSDEENVSFHPEGEELVIVREASGKRPMNQYRVWASEVSVAWNVFGWN